MPSNEFVKVKRPIKPTQNPQAPFQTATREELVPVEAPEIEQPEQLAATEQFQPIAEIPPDESVFGCGWSVTELMNEFSGRQ